MIARKLLLAGLVCALGAPVLWSETLAFEVASVKPNKSGQRGPAGMKVLPSGRLEAINVPLILIIATAYNVPLQSERLTGGPDWLGSDRFDFEATPPPGVLPSAANSAARLDMIRRMMQSLLTDRFKMAVRRETKEMPVYAVLVAKNGPKLEKSKIEEKDCPLFAFADPTTCHSFQGGRGRGLHGQAVTIADAAFFVSNWTDHPLVDKTGLTGLYDIQTEGWLPMQVGAAPASGSTSEDGKLVADQPTVFEIFTRMGLKLELQKAPVDMFIINHIEKLPEN